MRHRGHGTRTKGGVLPAVLVLVFVVVAAVNVAIAVVDVLLWPVVVAGCGAVAAIVVADTVGCGAAPDVGSARHGGSSTQGLEQLPSVWLNLRVNDGQGRPSGELTRRAQRRRWPAEP